MIFYLCTEKNKHPIKSFLKDCNTSLLLKLNFITYEQIIRYRYIPVGTYIFTDIELLTPFQAEAIAKIWQRLASIENIQLLNHPTRSMKRYELLRSLYNNGLNKFNVYHLDEGKTPEKFPVFLRVANDHHGSETSLIETSEELAKITAEFEVQGKSKENRIITEFCDTSDEQGIFRKYSAFIIGDRVIPISMFLGYNWMLKNSSNEQLEAIKNLRTQEESYYVATNPHQAELKKIFQLASIDYGRIDYSILNGKIQTWEINTNPYGFSSSVANRDCFVLGMPVHEYLSKHVKLAFNDIDRQTRDTKIIESPYSSEKVKLSFPLTKYQRLRYLCRALLPYPYRTYPFKQLIKVQFRKLKLLLDSFGKKSSYQYEKQYEI